MQQGESWNTGFKYYCKNNADAAISQTGNWPEHFQGVEWLPRLISIYFMFVYCTVVIVWKE